MLHIVVWGLAQCQKIPLDGGQIIGQVAVRQESDQKPMDKAEDSSHGDDGTEMFVAVLLFHSISVIIL